MEIFQKNNLLTPPLRLNSYFLGLEGCGAWEDDDEEEEEELCDKVKV